MDLGFWSFGDLEFGVLWGEMERIEERGFD